MEVILSPLRFTIRYWWFSLAQGFYACIFGSGYLKIVAKMRPSSRHIGTVYVVVGNKVNCLIRFKNNQLPPTIGWPLSSSIATQLVAVSGLINGENKKLRHNGKLKKGWISQRDISNKQINRETYRNTSVNPGHQGNWYSEIRRSTLNQEIWYTDSWSLAISGTQPQIMASISREAAKRSNMLSATKI